MRTESEDAVRKLRVFSLLVALVAHLLGSRKEEQFEGFCKGREVEAIAGSWARGRATLWGRKLCYYPARLKD